MPESFEQQWNEAIDRIRLVARKRAVVDLQKPGGELLIRILFDNTSSPFDAWAISRLEYDEEAGGDRVRTFGVTEFLGEMCVYTFFPQIPARSLLNGSKEVYEILVQEADTQDELGYTEPTQADYQEFFRVTEEIVDMGI